MVQSRARTFSLRWAFAFIAAALIALALAPAALAQQEDQYGVTAAPEGPAAGEPATVEGDDDGVVGPGTVLVIEGEFEVSEGASVTLQDSDGTQGTLIDGENAEITEGSIIIEVTAEPVGVAGGDGVLNTDGLFVVATTGITARGAEAAAGEAVAGDGTATAGDAVAGDGTATAGEAAAGDGTATAGDAAAGDGTATAGEAAAGDGTAAAGDAVAGDGTAAAGDAVAGDGAAVAGDGAAAAGDDAAGAEAGAAADEGPIGGVLPDTGGSLLVLLAAGLALLATGFLVRRQLGSR